MAKQHHKTQSTSSRTLTVERARGSRESPQFVVAQIHGNLFRISTRCHPLVTMVHTQVLD
jgi:hypothetical protein